jgi:transcriptional regulator GlxA family with amidase domain
VRTVGILIFPDVEVLDFCGPFEVFSVARKPGMDDPDSPLFHAVTIAESRQTIACIGGLLVEPHYSIHDAPPLDILVVPGGRGTRRERLNRNLVDWIAARDRNVEITASVCTGALLLAEAGLLDGHRATTHWSMIEWMRDQYRGVRMLDDVRSLDEGHIVTSAGISAGIDMCLHLVHRLEGAETAAWTARRMEYRWERPGVYP